MDAGLKVPLCDSCGGKAAMTPVSRKKFDRLFQFALIGLAVALDQGAHLARGICQADERPIRRCIEQFAADMRTLDKRYRVPLDDSAAEERARTMEQWLAELREHDFGQLDWVSKIDYLLLRSEIEYRLKKLELDSARDAEAQALLPYTEGLAEFCKSREEVAPIEPRKVAQLMSDAAEEIEELSRELSDSKSEAKQPAPDAQRLAALRASELVRELTRAVREADAFYAGYHPEYTWWVKQPMQRLEQALNGHRRLLREKVVGVALDDEETIVGLPIGEEGLALELEHEWIAHSPQELVELAEREMEWCEQELLEASADLGFGEDWRAAMEHTKARHVDPGEQPQMIRDLAWEAIRFLEAHDLVTVPPLAAGGWRMRMMSPEAQRVNPYFLGGDEIIVSFPTDGMTHDEKLMSMRSNNEHFARATVHHELIPGHHLQYYMLPRHRPYRTLFSTPFWIEGWALYWEMLLWDLDFAQSAEDRVGMLFWRKHRCARIIFSLSYHLGTMSPEECIDYLVERVGHERSAATAEVRRSIMGGYGPLYQAAYMLGGLQLRRLHAELVQTGELSNRDFHDAVLREHSIPIELLRVFLLKQSVSADSGPNWKFATP